MADLKKFLDQSGVSTLWTKVAENVAAEKARAEAEEAKIAAAAKKAQDEVDALETYVGVIPNGEDGNPIAASVIAYVNKKTEGIATDAALGELQATVDSHTTAIEKLNGDAETVGSVANTATTIAAAKVAEIVASADAKYDTLKEIADWILNDTTGAADMANDIAALQAQMAGIDDTVVAEIAAEIEAALKIDGVEKYALATELSALAARVKILEDADLDNRVKALEDKFDGDDSVASLIATAKQEAITAAATDATTKAGNAESAAKAYADGLASNYATAAQGAKADTALQAASITTGSANGAIAVNGTDVAVKGLGSAAYTEATAYDASGAAATAEANAKAYTDTEINTKVIALTTAEIEAAIAAASTPAQG
jgi:hypothetical protein